MALSLWGSYNARRRCCTRGMKKPQRGKVSKWSERRKRQEKTEGMLRDSRWLKKQGAYQMSLGRGGSMEDFDSIKSNCNILGGARKTEFKLKGLKN